MGSLQTPRRLGNALLSCLQKAAEQEYLVKTSVMIRHFLDKLTYLEVFSEGAIIENLGLNLRFLEISVLPTRYAMSMQPLFL